MNGMTMIQFLLNDLGCATQLDVDGNVPFSADRHIGTTKYQIRRESGQFYRKTDESDCELHACTQLSD